MDGDVVKKVSKFDPTELHGGCTSIGTSHHRGNRWNMEPETLRRLFGFYDGVDRSLIAA
jgi:hypothetical protein